MDGKPDNRSHVFILTGMGRSGTSMTASLLQAGGANMGERQLMAHAGNVKGHFENMDFLEFHQAVLRDNQQQDGGWVSFGNVPVPPARAAEAKKIIDVNAAVAGPSGWGWKDPRTTLFLDFWNQLLPDAHNILIYRAPWEVVDSIFRRGVSEDFYFRDRPEEAVRVWMHYNRCVLDFLRRHTEKSVLVAHDAVTAEPAAFIRLMNDRFGAALQMPPGDLVEPGLLHKQTKESSWPTLIARTFPEALDILEQLDAACSLRAPCLSPNAIATVRNSNNYAAFYREWFEGHYRARKAAKKSRLQRWLGVGGKRRTPRD